MALPLVAGCVELPAPAQQQLAQAEIDFRARNYRDASAKLEDVLRQYPEYKQSAEAYYLRAQVRIAQNDKLGAAADLKKCLALSNDAKLSARAHASAGQLAFEAGDFKGASDHFGEALKKLPENPPADLTRFRYALCLQRIGDWPKARQQFAMVVQRYPNSSVGQQSKAMFEWPWDYYVIQCGAFRDQAQAGKAAQRLQAAGLVVRVEPRQRLGETLYTVCVGNYGKYGLAEEALRGIKTKSPGAVIMPSP
jgi:tetratricopeptide (TPR) repeat protein